MASRETLVSREAQVTCVCLVDLGMVQGDTWVLSEIGGRGMETQEGPGSSHVGGCCAHDTLALHPRTPTPTTQKPKPVAGGPPPCLLPPPPQGPCSKLEGVTPSVLCPQAFRIAPTILAREGHTLVSLFDVF